MGELLLRKGDYVLDGKGGLLTAEGNEALLQRVLLKLVARRGGFQLLPELGSRLYLLPRQKPGERGALAQQYVAEALADEPELKVMQVILSEMNEARGCLTVELEHGGDLLTAVVEV